VRREGGFSTSGRNLALLQLDVLALSDRVDIQGFLTAVAGSLFGRFLEPTSQVRRPPSPRGDTEADSRTYYGLTRHAPERDLVKGEALALFAIRDWAEGLTLLRWQTSMDDRRGTDDG
jgi:hypothetical protein